MTTLDTRTPAPAGAPSIPSSDATATGRKVKTYQLRPSSEIPLPKKAKAKLKRLFKLKMQAAAVYEDMRALEAVLMPPDGRGGILKPGVVYRLPEAMVVGAGKKSGPRMAGAIRFTDNFAGQLKASRSCVIPRYELDTWVHGPALEKEPASDDV